MPTPGDLDMAIGGGERQRHVMIGFFLFTLCLRYHVNYVLYNLLHCLSQDLY